jgi:hypothetical protein
MPVTEGSKVLRMTIAGILGVVIVRNSIDEQIPTSCILAMPTKPVAIASCPARYPTLHSHGDELSAISPVVGQLTGISRGVSTAFAPLTDSLASAADCQEKERSLHPERRDEPVNVTITPGTTGLAFNEGAPDILVNAENDEDDMALAYNSAPCPEKTQGPQHLERKDDVDAANTTAPMPPLASTRQQFFENPAPVLIPAQRSNLVTVLTQYPPKAG